MESDRRRFLKEKISSKGRGGQLRDESEIELAESRAGLVERFRDVVKQVNIDALVFLRYELVQIDQFAFCVRKAFVDQKTANFCSEIQLARVE